MILAKSAAIAPAIEESPEKTPAAGWVRLVAPLGSGATIGEAEAIFTAHPDLPALPVVEEGKPVGLVSRAELFAGMTGRFTPNHGENEPVGKIMNRAPIVVEVSDDLERVASLAAEECCGALPGALIVTEAGRYLGIATAKSLLHAAAKHLIQRHHEIDRAQLAAEESNKSKAQFLAAVTHELRTPLNAIIGFSQIIADGAFGADAYERYRGYAQDILSSGEHLLEIINDILDISRIEAGKLVLREETVAAKTLVDGTLRLVRQRATEGRVRLETDIREHPCFIRGDKRLLRQLLLNLVANAVKFTLPGGRVLVRVERDVKGRVLLVVTDTGIGIAEEDIAKALMPFGQIDSKLGRRFDGTGLGLPLAKAMAEAHGGTLTLESRIAMGTTVTVQLPSVRFIKPGEVRDRAS